MFLPRSTRHVLRTVGPVAAATVLTLLVTGCSTTGPAPAADPDDGTLLLASPHGLLQVDDGALTPVGPAMDLMGFTVAGPGRYLASGHPGLHVDLPQPVGLIESTDGGHTWEPVSRQGQSDFHALTVSDAGVLGYDGALVASPDGRTWQQLQIPAEPHTLAAAPDGTQVLATTQAGLLRSTDAGASWAAVDGAPPLQVVTWADDGRTAVGVDPAGTLWTSADSGATWQEGAELGSPPQAVTASAADGTVRIAVVTSERVVESQDGGRAFTDVPIG